MVPTNATSVTIMARLCDLPKRAASKSAIEVKFSFKLTRMIRCINGQAKINSMIGPR